MFTQDLVSILQASLTPVVLISGVGLLLLSMTNRIARPLDRIRFLGSELKNATKENRDYYIRQIKILYKRCFLLQKSISFSVLSIVCASVIILLIFIMTVYSKNLILLIDLVFLLGLFSLVFSLIYFLIDIQASLKSVKIEMDRLKANYAEMNSN